jgi:hypothetical protein
VFVRKGILIQQSGFWILSLVSVFYLKTGCFGGWILSLSSDGTYSDGPIERASVCLRTPATPTGFIKPTHHNPSKRVNIITP